MELTTDPVENLPDTLVLWDVDHTLIQGGGVSKATYALAFQLMTGHPPAVGPTTEGRTDFEIMTGLLEVNAVDTSEYTRIEQFEPALTEAMRLNASELSRRGCALPGAVEALTQLASIPTVIQSVLTGNIQHNAQVKLSTFGLDRYLDMEVGGYGTDGTVRSRLVDAARRKVARKYGRVFDESSTILIGDTPLDVQAAHDGGARVIAVATGLTSAQELDAAGADVTLESLVDRGALLAALVMLRR